MVFRKKRGKVRSLAPLRRSRRRQWSKRQGWSVNGMVSGRSRGWPGARYLQRRRRGSEPDDAAAAVSQTTKREIHPVVAMTIRERRRGTGTGTVIRG